MAHLASYQEAVAAERLDPSVAQMPVGVVGLGLIGGSIGLALRRAGASVVGLDSCSEVSRRAADLGAVDSVARSVDEMLCCTGAIIVATPLAAMERVFKDISVAWPVQSSSSLHPPLVMDVGSCKSKVQEWAESYLAPDIPFVGGHPMAGSEKAGIDASDGNLFLGASWAICPAPWTDPPAAQLACSLAQAVGARPIRISPQDHDRLVAATSHLPLICASALARIAADHVSETADGWAFAAGGFRDTTRVAGGDPALGVGMALYNVGPVRQALLGMIENLQEVEAILANAEMNGGLSTPDQSLEDLAAELYHFFQLGMDARQEWINWRDSHADV